MHQQSNNSKIQGDEDTVIRQNYWADSNNHPIDSSYHDRRRLQQEFKHRNGYRLFGQYDENRIHGEQDEFEMQLILQQVDGHIGADWPSVVREFRNMTTGVLFLLLCRSVIVHCLGGSRARLRR
jgi:hypothetical protein